MSFCIVCFLHRFYRSQLSRHVDPARHHSSSCPPDLSVELEDSRRFSLSALTAFLAVLALSGSKGLQPVVLTLLIYTISLRLTISPCFLHNYPTLSRLLHALPLLGTSCMAAVALVSDLQSPGFAVAGILLGAFPLITLVIHHGYQCGEVSAAGLPRQIQDIPTPASQASQTRSPRGS